MGFASTETIMEINLQQGDLCTITDMFVLGTVTDVRSRFFCAPYNRLQHSASQQSIGRFDCTHGSVSKVHTGAF